MLAGQEDQALPEAVKNAGRGSVVTLAQSAEHILERRILGHPWIFARGQTVDSSPHIILLSVVNYKKLPHYQGTL
jgi:hypothetical protein